MQSQLCDKFVQGLTIGILVCMLKTMQSVHLLTTNN